MEKIKELKKKQNVVGFSEDDEQVTVFVSKKLKMPTIEKYIADPKSPWKETDIVPKALKTGFRKQKKTDVIEIGEVKALAADRNKYRPIVGGCEISPLGRNWVGTGGAVVKKIEKEKKQLTWWQQIIYLILKTLDFQKLIDDLGWEEDSVSVQNFLLTNAHVTQDDVRHPEDGQEIVQPGLSTNEIGYVVDTEPISDSTENELDASLVALEVDSEPKMVNGAVPDGYGDVEVGDKVIKYGRTTRLSSGTCKKKNVTVAINYGNSVGTVWFKGCDLYSYMSDRGDSGSVILSVDDLAAVGLLFAGSQTTTIAVPITKVMQRFKITI